MAQNKKGKNQALKDISNEIPSIILTADNGSIEVMNVTSSHLRNKKTTYLNKQLGL